MLKKASPKDEKNKFRQQTKTKKKQNSPNRQEKEKRMKEFKLKTIDFPK